MHWRPEHLNPTQYTVYGKGKLVFACVATVTGGIFNKWTQLIQTQSPLDYPRMNYSVSELSVPLMRRHQSWLCMSWFHVRSSAGSPRLSMQYVLDCLPGAGWGISLLISSAALSCCTPTVCSSGQFYMYLILYVVSGYPGYPNPSESERV